MGETELWGFMWVSPQSRLGSGAQLDVLAILADGVFSGEIFIVKLLRELESGNYEQWWWDGQWGFWLG